MDCSLLEGDIAATIEIAATRGQGFDEFFGAHEPCHAPAWEAESLGQSVDENHIVPINVDNVRRCRDGGAITAVVIAISSVELVEDQGCSVAAKVLDQSKLFGVESMASWVARVGGQAGW